MSSRPRSRKDETIAELRQQLAERDRVIVTLQAQVTALLTRVGELEAKLAENSRNSSRPPSSDPPSAVRLKGEPTGRKPGGQPGHKGVTRLLLPLEQVTRVIPVKPSACRNCGTRLHGHDEHPRRHRQVDVPERGLVAVSHGEVVYFDGVENGRGHFESAFTITSILWRTMPM